MEYCGTCHMASLPLAPLPGAATPTLFSETLLQAWQSQLPPALAATLALLAISHRLPSKYAPLLGPTTASSSISSFLQWRCTAHYRVHYRRYFLQPRASRITDCSTTLMKDFYYRDELLAINSAGKLSTPAGADQQNTRVAYKFSKEISISQALLLISNGGTRLTTTSTLQNDFLQRGLEHFLLHNRLPCDSDARFVLQKCGFG